MNWDRIQEAISIAEKLQYFFIATADKEGQPHVATAGKISLRAPGAVEISFWFCPKTLDNLQENKRIALIIWDAGRNKGYQLLGRVEDMQVAEVLDGHAPEEAEGTYLPQVSWWLRVRVDTVMEFIHALHNDSDF